MWTFAERGVLSLPRSFRIRVCFLRKGFWATDATNPDEHPRLNFVIPSDWLAVGYTRRGNPPDTTVSVQFATNLVGGEWIWGPAAVEEVVVSEEGDVEHVVKPVPGPHAFARIRASPSANGAYCQPWSSRKNGGRDRRIVPDEAVMA